MAVYCFRNASGDTREEILSLDALNAKRVKDGTFVLDNDGVEWGIDIASQLKGTSSTPGNWPMQSTFCGGAPDQRAAFEAHDRLHGLPTHYDEHCSPEFTGKKHREDYLKLHGYVDRGKH